MSTGLVNGVPTDLDVRRLDETFGTLNVGDEISYDEIDSALGIARSTSRWRTVTAAWRCRVQRARHLVVGCNPGVGFVILDDSGKLDASARKLRSGLRSCRRSVKVAAFVDRGKLGAEERDRYDHTTKVASAVLMAASNEAKRFQPSLPQKQLGERQNP